jgi:hypothetical protein
MAVIELGWPRNMHIDSFATFPPVKLQVRSHDPVSYNNLIEFGATL